MSLPETHKVGNVKEGHKGTVIFEDKPVPKPGKNQILVKVEYVPINPSDIINMTGGEYKSALPRPVGYEGSGVVVALGEDLKVPHKVGDKVKMRGYGTWAQYIVVESEQALPISEGNSLEESACHFVNPYTVAAMLHIVKKKGAKTAVHTAGSSALGRMLIRYFKKFGIKTINVVRRDDHTEELLKEGADYVLNSTNVDFDKKFREITEKEGATVAFDAIGGDFTGRILHNLPNNSSVYLYGILSGQEPTGLSGFDFIANGKKLKGFNLYEFLGEVTKSGEITQVVKEIEDSLTTVFRSEIQKVFKFEELDQALSFYNQNSSKGKILLKFH